MNEEAVNNRAKLLMHRVIARRLQVDRGIIAKVHEELAEAASGDSVPEHVLEWLRLIEENENNPVARIIVSRGERMDRLRLSSPFAFVVDFRDAQLRRRIWKLARRGAQIKVDG